MQQIDRNTAHNSTAYKYNIYIDKPIVIQQWFPFGFAAQMNDFVRL